MSTATETSAAAAGLSGVVAAQSAIGDVNGEQGILIYQGYDIHDLAEHSTFEEIIFLLWNGRLPKQDELEALTAEIRANYEAPARGDRDDEDLSEGRRSDGCPADVRFVARFLR